MCAIFYIFTPACTIHISHTAVHPLPWSILCVSSLDGAEVRQRAIRNSARVTGGASGTESTGPGTMSASVNATTTLTSSHAARTRRSGERATARSGPRKMATGTTRTPTAPTPQTNWATRTGMTWVAGRTDPEQGERNADGCQWDLPLVIHPIKIMGCHDHLYTEHRRLW